MTLFLAEKLTSAEHPRCEGIYHDTHHDPGGRCDRRSQYVIGGMFYCTKHAQPAALHILLEETQRIYGKIKQPKPKGPDYGKGYG